MKFKNLQEIVIPTTGIPFTPGHKTIRDRHGNELKPKFHVDVLTFGEERAMLEYIATLLKKAFPGIITEMNFNSDGTGWRLTVEILYGKSQEYVDFLKKYRLLDRSIRVGLDESQKVENARKTIEI